MAQMGESEEGVEPWFSMPYTAAPIPADLLEEWAGALPEADMKLPARNEFLPSDFELVSGSADGATAPMNGSGVPSGTGRKPAVNAMANGSHVQVIVSFSYSLSTIRPQQRWHLLMLLTTIQRLWNILQHSSKPLADMSVGRGSVNNCCKSFSAAGHPISIPGASGAGGGREWAAAVGQDRRGVCSAAHRGVHAARISGRTRFPSGRGTHPPRCQAVGGQSACLLKEPRTMSIIAFAVVI